MFRRFLLAIISPVHHIKCFYELAFTIFSSIFISVLKVKRCKNTNVKLKIIKKLSIKIQIENCKCELSKTLTHALMLYVMYKPDDGE
jgi:hypothetical protein